MHARTVRSAHTGGQTYISLQSSLR